jgi:hypothetical protein
MAKDKVKAHARRTKKGVARVAGHARDVGKRIKKSAELSKRVKRNKKIALVAAGTLGTAGAIVGLKRANVLNKYNRNMMKMASDVNNLAKKHGKKATSVMNNTAQEVTSAVGTVPKLTQDSFNPAQKAAMSGGVNLNSMDIRSAPGVGLTQAQRGVAMVPVNKPAMTNASTTTKVAKAAGGVAGRTYGAGKATRKAFAEGYANPGTGGAYQVGRNIAGGVKNTVGVIDSLVKRASKKRGN